MAADYTGLQSGGVFYREAFWGELVADTAGFSSMTGGVFHTPHIGTYYGRIVAIVGDEIDHGGYIVSANQSTVFCEGQLVAVAGAQVSNHPFGGTTHTGVTIVSALSAKVRVEGKAMALERSVASCNGSVIPGSSRDYSVYAV